MSQTRRASLRALAKINLDLRVLGRRDDGFHELRTIFQTISLADRLDIAFTPARRTTIEMDDALGIADNLAVRAAQAALEAMRVAGRVEMRLTKRIPMGAGLGGGSSDAAAVLLALPVLAGRRLALPEMCRIAQQLGSDINFFLLGGTAVGIGRGTELFPLPDGEARQGILIAPDVHVSTAEAYRALSASLTTELQENKIVTFQLNTWGTGSPRVASGVGSNDFESVVFRAHPQLARLKKCLLRAGATEAMMTGSGSALFGLFPSVVQVSGAIDSLRNERAFRISLVSRRRYRGMWQRALQEHTANSLWPPQSRYLP